MFCTWSSICTILLIFNGILFSPSLCLIECCWPFSCDTNQSFSSAFLFSFLAFSFSFCSFRNRFHFHFRSSAFCSLIVIFPPTTHHHSLLLPIVRFLLSCIVHNSNSKLVLLFVLFCVFCVYASCFTSLSFEKSFEIERLLVSHTPLTLIVLPNTIYSHQSQSKIRFHLGKSCYHLYHFPDLTKMVTRYSL